MKHLFSLLLFCATVASSQTLKILDATTQKPIPFATVLLKLGDTIVYGDYCSENGEVSLNTNKEYGLAAVSCVGYNDKTIAKADLESNIVYLIPVTYTLDEVVLTKKALKDTLMGELVYRRESFTPLDTQHQYAYFFENNFKGKVILKSFIFKTSKAEYKTAIRIHLLKRHDYRQSYYIKGDTTQYFYNSFVPGTELLEQNVILYIEPQKKGMAEADLSVYNLEIPAEGVFVVIECLAYYNAEGKEVDDIKHRTKIAFHETLTDNYGLRISLHSSFWINYNKWVKKDYELTFKSEPGRSALVAPSFGLKVLNYND